MLPAAGAWPGVRIVDAVFELVDDATRIGFVDRVRDPDFRIGVSEREFADASVRVLVEHFGGDALLAQAMQKEMCLWQTGCGVYTFHPDYFSPADDNTAKLNYARL